MSRGAIRAAMVLGLIAMASPAAADPILDLSAHQLRFTEGIQELELTILNAGDGQLEWEITSNQSWVTLSSLAGSGESTVTVTVDRNGLDDFQVHHADLHITSNGEDMYVDVAVYVSSTGPILHVTGAGLGFFPDTQNQEFTISNSGIGTLTWSIAVDEPWVSVSPMSGAGDWTTVAVTVDVFSLPPGRRYDTTIHITSNGGDNTVGVTVAAPPPAHGGAIGIYADEAGVNCAIDDSTPGVLTFHVVQTNLATAGGIEFSAPLPSCLTGVTWVGDIRYFPVTIGDSQSGVAVGYPGCLSSPVHVLSIVAVTQGTSLTCCPYRVLPSPAAASGLIDATDCLPGVNGLLSATSTTAIVNPDGQCSCMLTVRSEETTWGKLKSLYAADASD